MTSVLFQLSGGKILSTYCPLMGVGGAAAPI